MTEYQSQTDDFIAQKLLWRLVQCVGRAFFTDDRVAILDVLNEAPHYLRAPELSAAAAAAELSALTERQTNEPSSSSSAPLSPPTLKGADAYRINGRAVALPANRRMNMPPKQLTTRLSSLCQEERLVRKLQFSMPVPEDIYFLDYDWFYEMVTFRLQQMEVKLQEDAARNRQTYYQCPRCETVISGVPPRDLMCTRCKQAQVVPMDVSNVDVEEQQQQMREQLSLRMAGIEALDPRGKACALLKHIDDCEFGGKPIFPIPLQNILAALKYFKTRAEPPRIKFPTNRPELVHTEDQVREKERVNTFADMASSAAALPPSPRKVASSATSVSESQQSSSTSSSDGGSGGTSGGLAKSASTAVSSLKRGAADAFDDEKEEVRKRQLYAERYAQIQKSQQEAEEQQQQQESNEADEGEDDFEDG